MGVPFDPGIIFIWLGMMVLFFAFQLLACKAPYRIIRTLPLWVIGAWLVAAAAFFAGVFGHGTGVIAMHTLVAGTLATVATAAAVGDGLAWLVHHLRKRKRR